MDFKELSNNALIKRCAEESDNRLLWSEFYRRFDDYIRLMVTRYCGLKRAAGRNLIEDLTQDTYVRLLKDDCKRLRNYIGKNDGSIYSYLALIVRTAVSEYEKKKNAQKRQHQEKSLYDPVDNEGLILIDILVNPYAPLPDGKLMIESLRREVEMLLDEIMTGNEKERDKEIFLYHVYEGLSAQQISERVSLSPKRIRNIVTMVRRRLKARPPDSKKI
jgi:RNA polymerase sigma factor (sigma-70 family)